MSEPVQRLIAAWGPPTDMYTLLTGQIVVEYHHKNVLHVFEPISRLLPFDSSLRRVEPTSTSGFANYGAPYSAYRSARREPRKNSHYLAMSCRTTFITDRNQAVSGWEFTGDNCISMPPPTSEIPANLVGCRLSATGEFLTSPADCRRVGGAVTRS